MAQRIFPGADHDRIGVIFNIGPPDFSFVLSYGTVLNTLSSLQKPSSIASGAYLMGTFVAIGPTLSKPLILPLIILNFFSEAGEVEQKVLPLAGETSQGIQTTRTAHTTRQTG